MARLLAVIALGVLITGFFHPLPPLLIALLTLFMFYGGFGLVFEAIRWVGEKVLGEELWPPVERRLIDFLLPRVLGYGFGAVLLWSLASTLRSEFFPKASLREAGLFVISWIAVLFLVGAPIALFMKGLRRGLKGEERPSEPSHKPMQGVERQGP